MALVDDIIRGHYAPRKPLEDQRDTIGNEVLTLAMALAFGFLSFVAAVPGLVVEARLLDKPVSAIMLPSAFGTLALLPLFTYLIAAIQRGIARLLGGQGTGAEARRGLVWSLLVSSPWVLLSGLISEIAPEWLQFAIALTALAIFLTNWSVAIRLFETSQKG